MNRLARVAFLVAFAALIVILFTDVTQTRRQRAVSAIRKCETSVSIGMLESGVQYCKDGIELATGTDAVAAGWLARGFVQLAAVSAQQRRVTDAVHYCQAAIEAWKLLDTSVLSDVHNMKAESTKLCEKVIAAGPHR